MRLSRNDLPCDSHHPCNILKHRVSTTEYLEIRNFYSLVSSIDLLAHFPYEFEKLLASTRLRNHVFAKFLDGIGKVNTHFHGWQTKSAQILAYKAPTIHTDQATYVVGALIAAQ